MGLLIPHDTLSDFTMRYGQVFAKYKGTIIKFHEIYSISYTSKKITATIASLVNGRWVQERLTLNDKYLHLFTLRLGYRNINKAAYLVTRQKIGNIYKIGIHDSKYKSIMPYEQLLYVMGRCDNVSISEVLANSEVTHTVVLKTAVNYILTKGYLSCALSKDYCVSLMHEGTKLGLLRRNKVVGTIDPDTNAIQMYKGYDRLIPAIKLDIGEAYAITACN